MLSHVDVSFWVGGVLSLLIVVELSFMRIGVEDSLKAFAVVIWLPGTSLVELNISFCSWLGSPLVISLI